MQDEQRLWLRLHLASGVGRVGLIRIREAFGDPAAALAASAEELSARTGIRAVAARDIPAEDDPAYLKTLEGLERDGVRIVGLWDEDYPPLLRQIHDPPALLYVRGRLPADDGLAVVGSRRASEHGRIFTERLCRELSAAGLAIVSGLARGVDSAAHCGALAASGVTVGVLGCGIDRIYPPENRRLFEQVLERGAIVSEYPPGTRPLPGHFPG
ncbi:MAG: DNA-processing protein DprA, partial [Desulfuromonadales bacterium]|nr:DNA-processing protein DprA [Desulfuromonadales bacterium]NIS41030.1 DNA-processing protein DprA [Desulfuromonadales bacterium]